MVDAIQLHPLRRSRRWGRNGFNGLISLLTASPGRNPARLVGEHGMEENSRYNGNTSRSASAWS